MIDRGLGLSAISLFGKLTCTKPWLNCWLGLSAISLFGKLAVPSLTYRPPLGLSAISLFGKLRGTLQSRGIRWGYRPFLCSVNFPFDRSCGSCCWGYRPFLCSVNFLAIRREGAIGWGYRPFLCSVNSRILRLQSLRSWGYRPFLCSVNYLRFLSGSLGGRRFSAKITKNSADSALFRAESNIFQKKSSFVRIAAP